MDARTDRILPISQDTDGTPRWRYEDKADGTIQLQRWNGSSYVVIAIIQSGSCSLGGNDADAIHDNVAAEINAIAAKATPVSADVLVIEDSADSWNKKKATVGSISGTPAAHKTTHENGGADEISVAGLSGKLADDQPPEAHAAAKHNGAVFTGTTGRNENLGPNYMDIDSIAAPGAPGAGIRRMYVDVADTHLKVKKSDTSVVDLENPVVSDPNAVHVNVAAEISAIAVKTPIGGDIIIIEDSAASWAKKKALISALPVAAHASTHQSGGSDAIKLDDLATPDDNTDLNAGTSRHGLLLKATAPATGVRNVVAIDNGETVYKNAPLVDSTNPANLGAVSPGSQLVAARRDHVHAMPGHADLASGIGTNTHAQIDTHLGSTSNPHSVTKAQVGLTNVTDDAQLKRSAGDINSFTTKGTPVSADLLLIEDSADSNNKKKITIGTLPTGSDSDAIHDNVANEISAITEKTTPANDDILLIEDSAASYVKKKVKMSNLPGGGGLTTALASQYGRSIQGALWLYCNSSYDIKVQRTRQSLLWPGPRTLKDGDVSFAGIKSGANTPAYNIVRDSLGNLHTVYTYYGTTYAEVRHAISDDNGATWTENTVASEIDATSAFIGIGHDDTLHVVYGCYSSQYRLRYRSSSDQGTNWSGYATIASDASNTLDSYPVSIVVRTNGNVHVLYTDQYNLEESIYTSSWSTGNTVQASSGTKQYWMGKAVYDAINDIIHLVYIEADYPSSYFIMSMMNRRKVAGASWTSQVDIGDGNNIDMVIDRLGNLHLLANDVDWQGGSPYDANLDYYHYETSTATWSTAVNLDSGSTTYNYVYSPDRIPMSIGHDDVLHAIIKKIDDTASTYSYYYFRKPPGAEWEMMDEKQCNFSSTDYIYEGLSSMTPYVASEIGQDDALVWDQEQDAWVNQPIQNRPDKDLIQVENSSLGSDVALTTGNTFYDGPSVTLGPGYWLITAHATYYRSATTAASITARITDKTNHYASQQQYHESLSGITRGFSMQTVILLYERTTIYLQMTSSAGGASGVMRASCPNNSSGNNATQITAVKYRGLYV